MGLNYERGRGLPLDWLTSDQQRHLGAHRMRNLPTMTVLAERSEHRNVQLCTYYLLHGGYPGTTHHLWECLVWGQSSSGKCCRNRNGSEWHTPPLGMASSRPARGPEARWPGVARSPIAPTSRAAENPPDGFGLRPPSDGGGVCPAIPDAQHTQHALRHTALPACIFRRARPSRPWPFGNSAFGTPHHTTPHHTTPHHTTPHHTTPHQC